MPQKFFEDLRIPSQYGFKQLLFCAPADTLVVQTKSRTKRWLPERLYYRHISSEQYMLVGDPGETTSQDDPVVSCSTTVLAYNTSVHTLELDAEGIERHMGDWESVRLFDLSTRVETHVIDSKMLRLPTGTTRAWISKVLSFSETSDVLHVVVGLDDGSGSINYDVAALNIRTGELRLVASLPAIFM